jgi:hypothetical protein
MASSSGIVIVTTTLLTPACAHIVGMSQCLYSHLETHRLPDGPEAEWAGPLEPPT